MLIDLSEKVIVVTGASRGIGRALALAFARENAKIVVVYKDSHVLAKTLSEEINSNNGKCIVVHADVKKKDDVLRLYSVIKKELGRLDVLINNAGICDFLYEKTHP